MASCLGDSCFIICHMEFIICHMPVGFDNIIWQLSEVLSYGQVLLGARSFTILVVYDSTKNLPPKATVLYDITKSNLH